MGVGGGFRFPRWKGLEANPIALPGIQCQETWGRRAGRVPGSRGITRSPEVLAGGLTHKCLKGQAGFLGNPAVWGHIHTGTELCPEKIISHLRLVCVCAFGGGDGSLYRRSGDSHGLVTRGESHVPCSPQPFLLSPVTTQGESARCVSPTPSPPPGGSAGGAQLPFGPGASS